METKDEAVPRGFALISPERRRELGRMGGKAAKGRNRFTSESAKRARARVASALVTPEAREKMSQGGAKPGRVTKQLVALLVTLAESDQSYNDLRDKGHTPWVVGRSTRDGMVRLTAAGYGVTAKGKAILSERADRFEVTPQGTEALGDARH